MKYKFPKNEAIDILTVLFGIFIVAIPIHIINNSSIFKKDEELTKELNLKIDRIDSIADKLNDEINKDK
jgi:hypothetical protein